MGKKFLPTVLTLAAAALLVPYKVELDRDGDKLKSVKLRSLALQLKYTAPQNGKKAQIEGVIPGYNADKVKVKVDGKTHIIDGDELFESAKAVYEEAKSTVKEVKDAIEDELDDVDFDDLDDILFDAD